MTIILRKVIKVGDSAGITIPAKFGPKVGTYMKIKQDGSKIILEPFIQ